MAAPINTVAAQSALTGHSLPNSVKALGFATRRNPYNPEAGQWRDMWSTAETYKDRNVWLEKKVDASVMRSMNAWIARFFPMRRYNDINFSFKFYKGNRTLFPRLAPHATPQDVSAKVYQVSTTMQRYGRSVRANLHNLDNAEGLALFELQTATLGVALGDTIEVQCLNEFTNTTNYYRERERNKNKPYLSLASFYSNFTNVTDILHKHADGSGGLALLGYAKETMRGQVIQAAICAEGTKLLLSHGAANNAYREHGPGARANAVEQQDSRAATFDGVVDLYTVRSFLVEDREPVTPLQRNVTFGAHYRMTNWAPGCNPMDFCAQMQDAELWTMDDNRGHFKRLTHQEARRRTNRFDADGSLSAAHDVLASNPGMYAERYRVPAADEFYDLFIYKKDDGAFAKAKYFGHMETHALPFDAVKDVAETMLASQMKRISAEGIAAIGDGRALIIQLRQANVGDDEKAFFKAVTLSSAAMPLSGSVQLMAHNAVGGVNFPTGAAAQNLPEGFMPVGFGHPIGLFSLAAQASHPDVRRIVPSDVLDTAVRFTNAFNAWHADAEKIFGSDHPAFTGELAAPYERVNSSSEYARVQNSRNSIASNLFAPAMTPLVYRTAAPAAPAARSRARSPALSKPLFAASASAEEKAIDAVRAAVAPHASERVEGALGSKDAYKKFADAYSASKFAEAYAAHAASVSKESQAATDRSFAMFAATKLAPMLESAGAESVANTLHKVAEAVETNRSVAASRVESTINRWAVETATPAAAAPAAATSGASHVVTRLFVSHDSLAVATGDVSEFALAHPTTLTRAVTPREAVTSAHFNADSRKVPSAAFTHARRPLWAGSTSSTKRTLVQTGAHESVGDQPPLTADQQQNAPAIRGDLDQTAAFRYRWRKANDEVASPLLRANMHLFLLAPINGKLLDRFTANNICVPFDVLIEQPDVTMQASSMVFLSGRDGFAELAHAKFNVMMHVAPPQTLEMEATIYFVPIIKMEEEFLLVEDVKFDAYRGGQTLSARDPRTYNPKKKTSGGACFYFLEPYMSLRGDRVERVHSFTGRTPEDLVELVDRDARDRYMQAPTHPSALYYTHIFGLSKLRVAAQNHYDAFTPPRADNVITFQCAQRVWSQEKKTFARNVLNVGPQGVNMYDGYNLVVSNASGGFLQDMGYERDAVTL